MTIHSMPILAGALALLALAGCEQKKAAAPPPELPVVEKTMPAAAPLVAAGTPEALKPAEYGEGIQWAASVVEMTYLQKQGDATVKLFGTAGGDPAMNGLYSYLAFYRSPGEGWRVFKLGDFLEYRILAETPGRLDLELQESVIDQASGNISSARRRVIVEWKFGPDGAAPETLSVTPAE
ncbi:MAG: hypothetical protein ABWZ40_14455 [Caulobacterales bacterium]